MAVLFSILFKRTSSAHKTTNSSTMRHTLRGLGLSLNVPSASQPSASIEQKESLPGPHSFEDTDDGYYYDENQDAFDNTESYFEGKLNGDNYFDDEVDEELDEDDVDIDTGLDQKLTEMATNAASANSENVKRGNGGSKKPMIHPDVFDALEKHKNGELNDLVKTLPSNGDTVMATANQNNVNDEDGTNSISDLLLTSPILGEEKAMEELKFENGAVDEMEMQPSADIDEIENPSSPSVSIDEVSNEENLSKGPKETEIFESNEHEPIIKPVSHSASQASESNEVGLPIIKSVPQPVDLLPSPSKCSVIKSVKIQQTTPEPLAMFEVQVFSDGNNVALSGTATQSSTKASEDPQKFQAINSIDDKIEGYFSHTDEDDTSAWWQVKLASAVDVQKVTIYNRYCGPDREIDANKCKCRMSDANVELYDSDNEMVVQYNLGDMCDESMKSVDTDSCLGLISKLPKESVLLPEVIESGDALLGYDQSIGSTNSSEMGINDELELEELEQDLSQENNATSVSQGKELDEQDNELDIQDSTIVDFHDDEVGDVVVFDYDEDENFTDTTQATLNDFFDSKEDVYKKVLLSEKPAENAQDTNQHNSQQNGRIHDSETEKETKSNDSGQKSASATFESNDKSISSEKIVANPIANENGSSYHIFRPNSKGNGSMTVSSIAVLAAMILLVCCCCIGYRRRRSRHSKPSRGKYSAIGSEEFFNGTFSDDISFNGKDSDEEMSYGSDDDYGDGVKIELGSMHEIESNGGLTLEEING